MVHHNPGEPKFYTRFESPDYLGQLGYTGQVPKLEIQCGITYDTWQPGLIPMRFEERSGLIAMQLTYTCSSNRHRILD